MMKFKVIAAWLCGALVVLLAASVLRGFLEPLLAAGVIAIASWPLYERFAARLPRRVTRGAAAGMFTCVITVFGLGPLVFALGALVSESHAVLRDLALIDKTGVPVPAWLEYVPLGGPWLATRWESHLAHPGGLSMWVDRTDPAALFTWAESIGQFTLRHAFIVLFTVLLLFLAYRDAESVAHQFRQLLRHLLGERAESYLAVGTCAVRASVNSLLVVGLFDGIACWVAYLIAGVPHAALWAAITGAFALIPFASYAAVAVVALHITMAGGTTSALLAFGLGCAVLLFGDKVVRPVAASGGTHLPFVWVLMGCLGGFQLFGLVGVVIGPVVLTLARELWTMRIRDLVRDPAAQATLTSVKLRRSDMSR